MPPPRCPRWPTIHHVAARCAQINFATFLFDARRAYQALVIDRSRDQAIGNFRSHQYPPAIGDNLAGVFNPRGGGYCFLIDREIDQPTIIHLEGRGAACSQHYRAEAGLNKSGVGDSITHQHRKLIRFNFALIDDCAVCAALRMLAKHVTAGHEIAVRDIERAGRKSCGIDFRARRKIHALGIDQEHPTIGI